MATNEEMSAPDLLRSAARLIARARAKLNLNEKPCGSCGCRVFENATHARANERLVSLPTKLAAIADDLAAAAKE